MSVKEAKPGRIEEIFGVSYPILNKCKEDYEEGQWICVTHQRVFITIPETLLHLERQTGEHVMVWNCSNHGPESPMF